MTFRTGTILDPESTRINATGEDRDFYDHQTVDTRVHLRVQISKSHTPISENITHIQCLKETTPPQEKL